MTTIKPFKNQDYNSLEENYSSTRLFVDPEFPACLHSISHTEQIDLKNHDGDNILKYIEWRRPHEIIDEPHFVIDGFQRRDIGQGSLGDCWFVAAAGALTLNSELTAQVIPYDQTFDESEYTGMFHFRFWLFGEWNDVVIDDRLPCYKGQLVFCRNNKDRNELWAPLLEKAYAKVCGSYEVMNGGYITDGLIDFTGGIAEFIMLSFASPPPPDYKEEFKSLLYQAMERKSMIGCGIFDTEEERTGAFSKIGLITGHAYSVTQIKDLITPNGSVTLVRCLNPWSNSVEWKGDWSDNSDLWDSVAEAEKRKLKFHALHDGEFWMSYDDFFDNFDIIQICHRRPESLGLLGIIPTTKNEDELTWHEEMFHGQWKSGESDGGSGLKGQPPEKYWTNPQYVMKLETTDDDGEEKACTMIVSLMFKDERQRILNGEETVSIAFDVYRIKDDADLRKHIEEHQKLNMTHLDYVGHSGRHQPVRSISERFNVPPGSYIIIPNTLNYGGSGDYFLRIFTEKEPDPTLTTELTINQENLTELEINRPHVKVDTKVDNEPVPTPEPSAEETNTVTEPSKEETNNATEHTDGESEIKGPDVKIDDKADIKPVPAPESSSEQTNNVKKDIGGAFPGSKSAKPSLNTHVKRKEQYCTIQ